MGIDCKEVAQRLASDELTRANWRERVMVGFPYVYVRQMQAL